VLEFRQQYGIFLFSNTPRPVLGVKWPGREADLSPPSSSEVENECNSLSSPVIFVHGVDRDSFTFTFTLPLNVVQSFVFLIFHHRSGCVGFCL
jgi:hypothetical protein